MIRKYFRRLICLFLAFLIFGAVLPTGVSAETADSRETTPEELKAQLSHMYHQILGVTQSESLDGLCATLVTWELYIKKINSQFVSGDGKDQYDNYCDMDITSGGYYVHAFSAEDYTLEEALLAITNNGTVNVYNILIGFEKTRSAAGSRYGHTVFIGGIIDGTVYYVESNDYSVGGTFYTEGTPIGCSIEQFAAEYAGWATFEGAIVFSEDSYLDGCQIYPTDLFVQTNVNTALRTEPCYEEESVWSYETRRVGQGEIFRVDALVCNAQGNYWYRVAGEEALYFPAEETTLCCSAFDHVAVSDVEVPAVLNSEGEFALAGTIASAGSELQLVRCQVYSGYAGEGEPVTGAEKIVEAQSFDLGELSGELDPWDLEPGIYHCVISAVARNSFLDAGELKHQARVMELWTAEFVVQGDSQEESGLVAVSLDANGGSCNVQRAVVKEDGSLPETAVPVREGYCFDGWFRHLDGESLEPVYAGWTADTEGFQGWHLVDGTWRLYEEGEAVTGLLRWDGITYYVLADGSFHTGWLEEAGKTYYFFENGAAARGFVTVGGEDYVFNKDGVLAREWGLN